MRLHWGLNPLANDFVPGGNAKTGGTCASGASFSGSSTSASITQSTSSVGQPVPQFPLSVVAPSSAASQYSVHAVKQQQLPQVPHNFHHQQQLALLENKQRIAALEQQNVVPLGSVHQQPLPPPVNVGPHPPVVLNTNPGLQHPSHHNIPPATSPFHGQPQLFHQSRVHFTKILMWLFGIERNSGFLCMV